MAICIVCGHDIPPTRHKYCSVECMEQATYERQMNEKWDAYVRQHREKLSFTLDDYSKLCKERKKRGLPRISYGEVRAKLIARNERRNGKNESAAVS